MFFHFRSFFTNPFMRRALSQAKSNSRMKFNLAVMGISASLSAAGAYIYSKYQDRPEHPVVPPDDVLAFYLDTESQVLLKSKFPPKHPNVLLDRVVIVKNPSDEETEEFKLAMTSKFRIRVLAYFHDEKHQGVLLDLIGNNTLNDLARFPILPISSEKSNPESRLNKILTAIGKINRSKLVSKDEEDEHAKSKTKGQGTISPEEGDKKHPILLKEITPWSGAIQGKSTSHEAKLEKVDGVIVSGSFCHSKYWDPKARICKPFEGGVYSEEDAKCPFCVYMRQGPCGQVFKRWEECSTVLDKEKESGKPTAGTEKRMLELTAELKVCMEKNKTYHQSMLDMLNEKQKTGSDDKKP